MPALRGQSDYGRLLFTRKRTSLTSEATSALCHEQTSSALFDHLVGGRQQRWRHIPSTNRSRLTQHKNGPPSGPFSLFNSDLRSTDYVHHPNRDDDPDLAERR
jgi:hypothetical protein